MMVCPHCQGAEDVFSIKFARNELKDYRKNGARKSTQVLLDILKGAGISDLTLLDIGGGVGVIQHEMIAAGVSNVVGVDASSAYINAAKEEAEQRAYLDKVIYQFGDFVQLAPQIDSADIVTLDRVVCCYPDVHALVDLSSKHAKRYYALVFPRDNGFFKAIIPIFNFIAFKLWGNPFRTFIHSSKMVDSIVRNNGFNLLLHRKVGLWQVFVYEH
jgi:2-polyprenyl-3-methyl-5-hydroxy-6-metoxy-1,4-benzoquinol methylase